jgi:hypothetical protein
MEDSETASDDLGLHDNSLTPHPLHRRLSKSLFGTGCVFLSRYRTPLF